MALLGPLGADKALWTISKAIPKFLSAQEAAALVFSKTGAALAYYFGLTPTAFISKAGAQGIKEVGRIIHEKVKKAANKLGNLLKL